MNKTEDTQLLEKLYPGKLCEVNSIETINQTADAFSEMRHEYDVFIENNSSLIFAKSEAVLWSDDDKKSVVLAYKTLGAFEVWISAVDQAFKRSRKGDEAHNLRMAISNTHIEVFDTSSEFQGSIFLAGDEDLENVIFPNK
jgi:hypothetical protein